MKIAVDGHQAHVAVEGPPHGPCIVLVHGALHDHSIWQPQRQALAAGGRRVLAPDLPGHGASDGPALPSVEATAEWLVALLRSLDVRQATLAGHSMGSLVALEAAAREDTPAGRLVLVGTAFPMAVSPVLLQQAQADPDAAIRRIDALSVWPRGAVSPEGVLALMHRQQAAHAAAGHGNLLHHDLGVCDRYAGGLAAAARVSCAARLLLGEHDAMTPPKAAQALAQALDAEVLLLPTGHLMMRQAADAVTEGLAAFAA